MGAVHESISPQLAAWIAAQPVVFVATAPRADDGRINLSPKGLDLLRVLDERTVGYVDLTGSGIETAAHLRENGRITLMWCAFSGPPRIVRIHGRGEHVPVDDPRYAGRFPTERGARGLVIVHAERISDSCGYAVPRMELVGERTRLAEWTAGRSDDELAEYQATRNGVSIDGLPGLSD
jgi:hypothetical protein